MDTPKKLNVLLDNLSFGKRFICLKSSSMFFNTGKSYPVMHDEEGYVYLEDESGARLYTGDDAIDYDDVIFVEENRQVGHNNRTVSVPQRKTLNSEDKEMTPNKVRETINRLNGVKPFQDRLVSLRQVSSRKQSLDLDLAHLLLTSEDIKALKPGQDCLITGLQVDLVNGKVTVESSVGKVEREENTAVADALTKLVSDHTEA